MNLKAENAWTIGVLLLLIAVVLGELSVLFDDYVFRRIGINRNYLLVFLWLFPLGAAFIASCYSSKYKIVAGLSYALIFPLLAAIGHFISSEMGGAIDFIGVSGAIVYFKINFVIGMFFIMVGTFVGFLFSMKGKSN